MILNFIRNLINPHLNEHKFAMDKLKEHAFENLDLMLVEYKSETEYKIENNKTPYQTKMTLKSLIYRLLLIRANRL